MSWFDRLFGESKDEKEIVQHEQPVEQSSHSEIYRRPRGKFRFPIDVGETETIEETPLTRDEQVEETEESVSYTPKPEFVNTDYFAERKSRPRRHVVEQPVRQPKYIPAQHHSKFVASEVPSAIFGTRKNLKPSEKKVVITPLTGKKPESAPPETPNYRKQDNMVNIENVYALQIVSEIRKEREKKARAKKAFEEERLKQQSPEQADAIEVTEVHAVQPPVETIEIETIDWHEQVAETPLPQDDSRVKIIEVDETPASEDSADQSADIVKDDEANTAELETPEMQTPEMQTPEVQPIVETKTESDEVNDQEQEVTPVVIEEEAVVHEDSEKEDQSAVESEQPDEVKVNETPSAELPVTKEPVLKPDVKKARPFNVMMTPSDKKRLMDERKSKSAVTEPVASEQRNDEVKEINEADELKEVSEDKMSSQLPSTEVHQTSVQTVPADKNVTKRKGPKYLLPPISLLAPEVPLQEDFDWVDEQKQQLDDAFYHFNVPAKVENVVIGPSVTRYELSVEKGVKVSRITNLQDDIKMALAAKDIRIEAPISGTSLVGVEVPNKETRMVNLSEVIFSKRFKFADSKLMVALGVKINNEPMLMDIAKMPHALIAGATGSGKSVSINAILLSLLYRNNPNELKLLMIDPKMVELAPYNDIPHLIAPVITDVKAATESLKWVVEEMERRYKVFADVHVRNITAFNQKSPYDKRLPKIVVVIDELADLMMMAPQEVEHSIARIAQKARAAGIHLILATQRPSVNVITGLIKANVPTRIAFMVSSSVDSRTILDNGGAEKLLGNGDMLYQGNGMNKPIRIQGCYVSDEEIDAVVNYVKGQGEPNYLFQEKELLDKVNEIPQDELFDDVVEYMRSEGHISTSQLQRHFQIGYNRAARIIDSLESLGYISGANGSKPRTVLMTEKGN